MAFAYELEERRRLQQARQRMEEANAAYQREVDDQKFREADRRDEESSYIARCKRDEVPATVTDC